MADLGRKGAKPKDDRPGQAAGPARFGLPILAIVVAAGALLRVKEPDLVTRLDQTTLLYLAAAALLLVLPQVKILSLGQFKLEMIERLRANQEKQDKKLSDIDLILPILLPDEEKNHIKNLSAPTVPGYVGGKTLQAELRRLCEMRLLERVNNKHIAAIKVGEPFDLRSYVKLTPLGEHWATRIREIEAAATSSDAKADSG